MAAIVFHRASSYPRISHPSPGIVFPGREICATDHRVGEGALARRRARPSPARGLGGVGILRPVVFWISTLQVFLHLMISAVPEAHEIPGDLHRSSGRRQ